VTIFGNSAGGASVSLLSLSPLARGLFKYAIMQSGVGTYAIAYANYQDKHTVRLVLYLIVFFIYYFRFFLSNFSKDRVHALNP